MGGPAAAHRPFRTVRVIHSDNLSGTYKFPIRGCAHAGVASPQRIGTGMDRQNSQQRFLPQAAGCAVTSDLARVVGSPSRMASCFISNVSEVSAQTTYLELITFLFADAPTPGSHPRNALVLEWTGRTHNSASSRKLPAAPVTCRKRYSHSIVAGGLPEMS